MSNIKVVWNAEVCGCSPAIVDRSTGIIYLNPHTFKQLSRFKQKFILWHEIGHYILMTDDEIKADAYAFDKLAGTEFKSLEKCLSSLYEVLPPDNPSLNPRIKALYKRALVWLYRFKGSQEAKHELLSLERKDKFSSFFDLLSIGKESYGDFYAKAMQSNIMVAQQFEAERINERNSRKAQQNLILLMAVGFAIMFFFIKK